MDTKNKQDAEFLIGIDVGSTTVKIVVLGRDFEEVYSNYVRHYANIKKTVHQMLTEVYSLVGNALCTFSVTGSGGFNLAKYTNIDFVQEVIAVTSSIRELAPDTDVVIELGGEDAKIIYLTGGVEQRMNGICAGGTGSFIDQMASLLQTDAAGLNEYAKNYKELYPIASRCGVFAKSDIQPLINDGVSREDLAASIFEAVVNQTVSGLSCGRRIKGKVAFLGGPLYFLSELREAFKRTLKLTPENIVFPENAHLFAARGAALHSAKTEPQLLDSILFRIESSTDALSEMNILDPLFEDEHDYMEFCARQGEHTVKQRTFEDYEGLCFMGLDAGSTTTKLVLVSDTGELLYSFYSNNKGDPIQVAKEAFEDIKSRINPKAKIAYSCSTGYGEALLKAAFHLDEGEVETISHYYAARFFDPEVDCILDIGGQDMKCIKIKDNSVDSIILNEACSSGCGSFIENFANSMGYTAAEFSNEALFAKTPVDLGTRCTIFMNSNVKQAQKEGASVQNIAAGLAYSVIKNALFKVIKLTDASELGRHIVVQGGTFYNEAVLRAFELISGHEAIRPNIAGLMGAFGAALVAMERYNGQETSMLPLSEICGVTYTTRTAHCGGCQNNCRLTVNIFSDGERHISGNRCEKGLKSAQKQNSAPDLFTYKKKRMFDYEPLSEEDARRGTIGIPRVLNIYEDYPFWAVFFKRLGFRVVLSPFSDRKLFSLGMDSIPSESECYPAKISHGHIEWLISQGVKTIFYPCVFWERSESEAAENHFNCPMVISYPENIRNNIENLDEKHIRYINPFISFADEPTLKKRLGEVMEENFNIPRGETSAAVHEAWAELLRCKQDILEEGAKALKWIEENNAHGIVLAGRPYHLDPEINHGIPEMIHSYGFAILTEDSVSGLNKNNVKLRTANQWMYHARLYAAAELVAERSDLDLVQLNSFGCGIDAITIDQVQELITQSGKLYTLLKIDEVTNLGAARIRIRSLISALKMRKGNAGLKKLHDYERVTYTREMQKEKYTILCTGMTPFHFDMIGAAMRSCGYNPVMLKNENQNVIDMGLKYVNNDACYPALIITGQMIDAITSGEYDTDHLAVMMIQTGGACRASNYLGFIRKALKDAGYPNIPVISINLNGMEKNPGFSYTPKLVFKLIQAAIYGDIFSKCVYRVRPYELVPGGTNKLFDRWHSVCIKEIEDDKIDMKRFYSNCDEIIKDFDSIPENESLIKPKVGIVGETLVKFMPLANNHLADILEENGAEVCLPDMLETLEYCLSNSIYKSRYLGRPKITADMARLAVNILEKARSRVFDAMEKSRHFTRPAPIERLQEYASQILQIGNQYGEGWFLPAEIIDLIKTGAPNIVCIQPFGCLPNHVVGKGIIKKVKALYPEANIVAVDYDPSASKVNQLNRIKLMLEVAEEKLADSIAPKPDAAQEQNIEAVLAVPNRL